MRSSPGPFVPVRKILVVRSGNKEIQSAFIISLGRKFKNDYLLLRLGAQSSYVVKYFEGSNAVKTTSMRN